MKTDTGFSKEPSCLAMGGMVNFTPPSCLFCRESRMKYAGAYENYCTVHGQPCQGHLTMLFVVSFEPGGQGQTWPWAV
jgi:hypothetical protein